MLSLDRLPRNIFQVPSLIEIFYLENFQQNQFALFHCKTGHNIQHPLKLILN